MARPTRSTPGSAAADRPARLPAAIEARGVRHNNLRDLDVDIPPVLAPETTGRRLSRIL